VRNCQDKVGERSWLAKKRAKLRKGEKTPTNKWEKKRKTFAHKRRTCLEAKRRATSMQLKRLESCGKRYCEEQKAGTFCTERGRQADEGSRLVGGKRYDAKNRSTNEGAQEAAFRQKRGCFGGFDMSTRMREPRNGKKPHDQSFKGT